MIMDEKIYKVFIPCAGIGSRLGLKYNKALTTIGYQPVIAHIIDKIPCNIEVVIALGYDGDNVQQVVETLYPDRPITYTHIDPYEGPESGLGLTLLQSKDELQCPFIFYPCDTIIKESLFTQHTNWMGYADRTNDSGQYRMLNLFGDGQPRMGGYRECKIKEICSKNANGEFPYIGLAGIYDYEIFWKVMEEGKDVGSIEMGEVFGLKYLLDSPIYARKFTWFDTGNPNSLKKTREEIKSWSDDITANILPKDDEAIWFVNIGSSQKTVVKFSTSQDFIINRGLRADGLVGYVPKITQSYTNLYTYDMQPGDVLSNKLNPKNFQLLLDHLQNFWQPQVFKGAHLKADTSSKFYHTSVLMYDAFINSCQQFYKEKTYTRVKKYLKTFEQIDQPETINGVDTPGIWDILDKIDWDWICDGVPSTRFHGDLHFENILIDNGEFTFLDWRQDFGGLLQYGDIYYDLAKLNHGILISHELITKNLFSHSISNNIVTFDFLRKNVSVELEQMFKEFIIMQGYHYKKVQYLTYLIFLNIAALHHYPYGLLLFHLGKSGLWNLLEQEKDST